MKKINTLTITLHDTDNCGSSLQAYGLQHFLLKNGINNTIIDYVPYYTQNNGHVFKTIIRKIIFRKESEERRAKFLDFKKRFLKVTDYQYHKLEELKAANFSADLFITGSDQLWNDMYTCGEDPSFYLCFEDKKPKIAYAMSMGREEIPDSNLKRIIDFSSDYKWISVREKSSVKQIKNAINSKVPVDLVCDPTLLINVSDYKNIMDNRLIEEKYILAYVAQFVDDKYLTWITQNLAKKYKAKIVFVGTYREKCKCDFHIRTMAPGDFLSLIYNAEFVISNSFHASIFSLLYHKQFVTILPPGNSERIIDLLKMVELEEHVLQNGKMLFPPRISDEEFKKADDVIKEFSQRSGNLLLKQINKYTR